VIVRHGMLPWTLQRTPPHHRLTVLMSDLTPATSTDPVYLVWATLREQGFDAALKCAIALAQNDARLQIHVDLCASAGQFEQAYRLASLAQGDPESGVRYARLALFADALGKHDIAKHYGELTVSAQPEARTVDWIIWLIDHCGAWSAAASLLRAYECHAPYDARAPWWLAVCIAQWPGAAATLERREALARAYALDPEVHPALGLHLALAYREIRDWDAVERVCRELLARHPADSEIAWQLSHAQWQRNDAAAAEATMRAVNAAAPRNAAVLTAIGQYLIEQARYREGETTLHAALDVDPADATAAVDLAELELRRGDWSSAWPRYEGRLARDDRAANNVMMVMPRVAPRWHGQPLAGKTLMVHSEQGNGDDIQMVRFLPELATRVQRQGGRLLLAVRRALQPLFARFYADCVSIEDGPLGQPHYGLPMMSVPYILGLQPEAVRGTSYLHVDPERVAAWRDRVRAANVDTATLQIGLVWCGSPTHRRDTKRSIPLAELAPVLALPDVVFHPLTPGLPEDVATLTAQGCRVRDLTGHYAAGFDDVAAHVSALDALLTIDSAPLHLGGALGLPVLAMLDHVSHWCWGEAETQPWYDSVEVYRQPRPGAWAPVVERVAARLQALKLTDHTRV
jgi:tetratricopeptide (TPR) repeat protein